MKKTYFFILLFLSLLTASLGESLAQELRIDVTNPLNLVRQNEVVAVRWSDVVRQLPDANPSSLMLAPFDLHEIIVIQAIDMDSDGTVDELLFRDDFAAGETRSYLLRQADENVSSGRVWTDARFMTPRQDLAWENDRIAFRMYGPALAAEVSNGVDVLCKRVRTPVLEKWYRDDENKVRSYHEDHGEGADFFTVGRTLGGGGSALWSGDSLLQPGVFESYKILATGPIRAMFELAFKPVLYNRKHVRELKRITLDAGQSLNRIDITYTGDAGPLTFAAGLVKRKGTTTTMNNTNQWISLYGLTTDQEVNGHLGTGAVLPGEAFTGTREDSTHLLILGSATAGKPVTYYAGAGWTRSDDFKDKQDWERYLDEHALKLKSPLVVRVAR